METEYKEIPFDINRINEEGVQITTRDGRNVRIICTDGNLVDDRQIVVLVDETKYESVAQLFENGKFHRDEDSCSDLIMIAPCKLRRMTNQELAWWLRDCPEEHREYKYEDGIYVKSVYEYLHSENVDEVKGNILIRHNGGAWEEPLIENKL